MSTRYSGAGRAWLWGGALLIASALVPVVLGYGVQVAAAPALSFVRSALGGGAFMAAMWIFAFGVHGEGSVVSRRGIGVAALLTLGLVPLVVQVLFAVIPWTQETVAAATAVLYSSSILSLAAGMIAVVEIARFGPLPDAWRWAPAWALTLVAAPQIIAELYVVAIGPVAATADGALVLAVCGYAAMIISPVGLGILAIVLGAQRREPQPVRVFP